MRIPTIFTLLATTISLGIAAPAAFAENDGTIAGAKLLGGAVTEGGMIWAQAPAGATITLDDRPIAMTADGYFVVGFHRDSDNPQRLVITAEDGISSETMLTPAQREYDIQRIDGLATNMVTPPQERIDRIKRDAAAVRAARANEPAAADLPKPDFMAGFSWPATGRISGIYGSQRILNGKPRQPHYGIDIAAPRGTAVRAPAAGVITMVGDLYFSGWTVMMAHGLGVNSGFLHLDRVDVAVGDTIARGDIIGTVGSTGRSTGPHLDWRIDWQGRRIDASLLVPPMP